VVLTSIFQPDTLQDGSSDRPEKRLKIIPEDESQICSGIDVVNGNFKYHPEVPGLNGNQKRLDRSVDGVEGIPKTTTPVNSFRQSAMNVASESVEVLSTGHL
jgi:hypothetical protein